MKKTVVHIITSLKYGGTERFLFNILKYLNKEYQFAVCYLKERGPVAEEIEKMSVPVFKVRGLWGFRGFLAEHKADIVHTHLYRANVLGRIAAHAAGIKQIISSQRAIDDWKKIYHVWLDRWTAQYADVIIANSQAVREVLIAREKIPATKIKIVFNGFSPESIFSLQTLQKIKTQLRLDSHCQVVGTVTRFHPEKGVEGIPEIISRVIRKKPKTIFVLVGDGPIRKLVEKEIKNCKLEQHVRFTGFQLDTAYYYHLFDVFFLPSKEESFPQALLDAIGYGTPAMAAAVGGTRELIIHHETGLLAAPGDSQGMAEAIVWLLDHRQEAEAMAHKGKQIVADNFLLPDKIKQIKQIYG